MLADLLNGTAYDLVLLGDLGDGAPRELILTPATAGGAAHAPAQPMARRGGQRTGKRGGPAATSGGSAAGGATPPPTPGVRTPQQLFEQLQRMRQAAATGDYTTRSTAAASRLRRGRGAEAWSRLERQPRARKCPGVLWLGYRKSLTPQHHIHRCITDALH